jgi:hypothetical protein
MTMEYVLRDHDDPDPPLTPEQNEIVAQLSLAAIEEIDQALLRNVSHQWCKVAMVVAKTMMALPNRVAGIPDVYYSGRVRQLVSQGQLESQGNLQRMRFSEVRLPRRSKP